MAGDRRFPEGSEDLPHDRLVSRTGAVLGSWIIAILILFAGLLLLGPGRVFERPNLAAPLPLVSVSGTGDVLVDDRAFAPDVIAVHPGDRLVIRNAGEETQALTLRGREEILDEEPVEPGTSFTFAIPTTPAPAHYWVDCTTHPNRCLELVVESGSRVLGRRDARDLRGERPPERG